MLNKRFLSGALIALVVVGSGVNLQLPQANAAQFVTFAAAEAAVQSSQYASMGEIARTFDGKSKVYLAGNPFVGDAEIKAFQQLAEKYDNLYVFLVEKESDLQAVKKQLSDKVFNHPTFEGMVNPVLGEKDGMAILYVKSSDLGAKSYLMTEGLQRRLGVGEPSFSGGPLGNIYQTAKSQGKNIPGRFAAVLDEIDRVVTAEERNVVASSNSAIADAKSAVVAVQQQSAQFAKASQVRGAITEPPLAKWQSLIGDAETAQKNKQFGLAIKSAQSVNTQAQAFSDVLGIFGAGSSRIATVEGQLQAAENEVKDWSASSSTTTIKSYIQQSRTKLKDAQAAYSAGELSFAKLIREAESQVAKVTKAINAVKAAEAGSRALIFAVLFIAFGVSATVAFFANRSARAMRKRAFELYENAKNEATLLVEGADEFATEVKFLTLVSSNDPIVQKIQRSMSNVVSAITGFERIFREVRGLIEPNGVVNRLTVGSYKQAIAYLEDPAATIAFDPYDLPEYLNADGLKAWAAFSANGALGSSMNLSLGQLVAQAREEFASAKSSLEEYLQQAADAKAAIEAIPQKADELLERVKALGNERPYALPLIATTVVPAVVGSGKLLEKGQSALEATPTVAWSEYLEPATSILGQADKAITVGEYGQGAFSQACQATKYGFTLDGIDTRWLDGRFSDANAKLVTIVGTLGADGSMNELERLHQEMLAAAAEFELASELNQSRKLDLPQAVSESQSGFADNQVALAAQLQKDGRYLNGSPEALLAEEFEAFGKSVTVSALFDDCTSRINELPQLLSQGAVKLAEASAQAIGQRLEVVANKGAAAIKYAKEFNASRNKLQDDSASVLKNETEQASFLVGRYQPEAIALASQGTSVDEIAANCRGYLGLCHTTLSGAEDSLGSGRVLESQRSYATALSHLEDARKCIAMLESIKQTLARKVQEVASKSAEVERALSTIRARRSESYIRSAAAQAIAKLPSGSIGQEAGKLHPFATLDRLTELGKAVVNADELADRDERAYNAMISAREDADREIRSANSKLGAAAAMHFSYATIHLGGSRSELSDAEGYYSNADRLATNDNFEEAARAYNRAKSAADSAYSMAVSAISTAETENRDNTPAPVTNYSSNNDSNWGGGISDSGGGGDAFGGGQDA